MRQLLENIISNIWVKALKCFSELFGTNKLYIKHQFINIYLNIMYLDVFACERCLDVVSRIMNARETLFIARGLTRIYNLYSVQYCKYHHVVVLSLEQGPDLDSIQIVPAAELIYARHPQPASDQISAAAGIPRVGPTLMYHLAAGRS